MAKKQKTKFERLKEKIEKDLGIQATHFERTRAGLAQLSSGGFSWTARMKGGLSFGSGESATDLLKYKKLEILGLSIYDQSGLPEVVGSNE